METASYILSILGLASVITASLIKGKNMKKILFFVFFGNVLVATSYLLGDSGINGAASCYIGGIQSIINYFFESKNKPLPKWLVGIYMAAFVGVNLAVSDLTTGWTVFLCAVAIIASLSFVMCIGQKSGAKYRFWTIVNSLLWILYDVLSKSYGALTTHILLLAFTVAGMIIHDRKKQK